LLNHCLRYVHEIVTITDLSGLQMSCRTYLLCRRKISLSCDSESDTLWTCAQNVYTLPRTVHGSHISLVFDRMICGDAFTLGAVIDKS
jgi:hypothetical protein